MPELGVNETVEKMLGEAAPVEKPPAPAPVPVTPESTPTDAPPAPSPETTAAELTAFDQELIAEYQEEYDTAGDKPTFLKALKRSYRKQAKQMTELGQLRKAVGALRDAGVSNDDLIALVNRKKAGSSAPSSPPAGEGKRGFQRYLQDATDPAEREQLRTAEQVMREVVEDAIAQSLDREVKPLKEQLDNAKQDALRRREATLMQEIDDLENTHGWKGSVVESYRQAMLNLGLSNPQWSARKLLNIIGDPDVLEIGRVAATAPKTPDAKPPASPVIKKPAAAEVPRSANGRSSITKFLNQIVRNR